MRSLLAPLGWAYSSAMQVRRGFYSNKVLKSERLSKPVVSVGNLTVGGTGKTPVVDAILTQLEGGGKSACVLTRGYGRQNGSGTLVTAKVLTAEGGDEPVWLSRRHPKSIVAVGADRVASSKRAPPVDIFILDDGLQHLEIKRDFEIVLLDSTRPLWHYRPLPWGFARESFSAIERADLVILTRVNQANQEQVRVLRELIKNHGVSEIIESRIEAGPCAEIWSGKELNLAGKNALIVSAIANPESFERLVHSIAKNQSFTIVGAHRERDHFNYQQNSIKKITDLALRKGANTILMTEKDGVKWRELVRPSVALENFVFGELTTDLNFNPPLPSIYELAFERFS